MTVPCPVKCFFVEGTHRTKLYLRRYRSTPREDDKKCPKTGYYHDARVSIGEAGEKSTPEGYIEGVPVELYQDDPRWPVKCDACGYLFNPADESDKDQIFQDSIYRRTDTGEEKGLCEWQEVPGAMWDAWWVAKAGFDSGPDGKCLVVILPDGCPWTIDGTAHNCDSPCVHCGRPYHAHNDPKTCPIYFDSRPHKCWVRHGAPPELTVDKNGVTCSAGAGSIVSAKGWHGFLRGGYFVGA
jgi:hypothetical protein